MKKLFVVTTILVLALTAGVFAETAKSTKPATTKAPVTHSCKGTVKGVEGGNLMVTETKGEMVFALEGAKITKAGKTVQAADIKAGDHASVAYHVQDGKNQAKTVVLTTPKATAASTKTATKK